MERISSGKLRAALILAIAALAFYILDIVAFFNLGGRFIMSVLIDLALDIAPIILLIIYILDCNKQGQVNLMPVVYGILLLNFVIAGIRYLGLQLLGISYFFALVGAALGLAAAIKGFFNKKLVYASAIFMLLYSVLGVIVIVSDFQLLSAYNHNHNHNLLMRLLPRCCYLISFVLLTVSLLILGLNHTHKRHYALPTAISGNSYASSDTDTSSVLLALEADYRSGKISSAEYSARRAEIIKKL